MKIRSHTDIQLFVDNLHVNRINKNWKSGQKVACINYKTQTVRNSTQQRSIHMSIHVTKLHFEWHS